MIRVLRVTLAAVLALAAGLAGAAVLALPFLPRIAEWAVAAPLSARLDRPVSLEIRRLGLDGAEIADLAVGNDFRAERAELRWTVGGLLAGRIHTLALDGVTARARVDRSGVSFGVLDALFGTGDGAVSLDEIRVDGAELRLQGPWGTVFLPMRASLDGEGVLVLVDADGVRVELTARHQPDGSAGQVWLQAPWGHGLLEFRQADSGIAIEVLQPLAVHLEDVPAWLPALAPEALAPALRAPVRLRLGGVGEAPARLRLTFENGEVAAAAGRARLDYDAGAAAHMNMEVDAAATAGRLAVHRFSAEVRRLPVGPAELEGVLRVADYAGTLREGAGAVRLHLVARDLRLPDIALDQGALTLSGRLLLSEDRLALALAEAGSLYLAGLHLGETVRLTEPAALRLGAGATASIEAEMSADGALTLIPDLPVQGALALELGGFAVHAEVPQAHLQGAWTLPAGLQVPVVTLNGATLRSDELGLVARQVDAVYAHQPDGPAAHLDIGEVRRRAGGREGLPLAGTAELETHGDVLAFAAKLTGASGALDIAVKGQHATATGTGSLRVSMPPAAFGPQLRPRDLLPHFARDLGAASGTVAVNGTVRWGPERAGSDLELRLADYSGAVDGVAVGGLDTTLRITGLVPLQTAPAQTLKVGLIDAGIPLLDGTMTYGVDAGRLTVARAATRLAGGSVRLGRTVLDLDAERQRIELQVEGVDLERLIAMVELEGLQATGTLTGTIPLVLGGESPIIADATLVSTAPGVLRYRPQDPPTGIVGAGESMELLLKALDDFHYDELTMTLNGRTGGELVATMKIKGANPSLYGGYPIEFNLNVSGKLGTILDDAVSSYQIPDRIRERMSDFGAR